MRKLFIILAATIVSMGAMAGEGALPGKFTINNQGGQVVFSQGNLRATTTNYGEDWTWEFAEHQWDYIGPHVANNAIIGNGAVMDNGSVDLFGLSTVSSYFGIHDSQDKHDYTGDFVDWGTNPIINGGNTANAWRSMDYDEWVYLLVYRSNAINLRGSATVNGEYGYILLPDDWSTPAGLSFEPNASSWTTNDYSGDDWTAMEENGAVFMPAAGRRLAARVMLESYEEGRYGHYWISSPMSDYFRFDVDIFKTKIVVSQYPSYNAFSVRLVQDYEQSEDIDDVQSESPATKILRDGQLLIRRGEKIFSVQGSETK